MKKEIGFKAIDTFWLYYIDGNLKIGAIPFVYILNKAAIKNLLNGEVVYGDFSNKKNSIEFAKKLGIKNCVKIACHTGKEAMYRIFSLRRESLPKEIRQFKRLNESDGHYDIDYLGFSTFVQTKEWKDSQEIYKYAKIASKLYKKTLKKEYCDELYNEITEL